MKVIFYLLLVFTISACGLFDSGSKNLTTEYDVGWIDTDCSMKIYRGPLGLLEGQIFHVGWNSDFIIAKQHPECDKDETMYFIINIKENQSVAYSQTEGVYGPLPESEFRKLYKEMGIPSEVKFTYEP